MNKISLISVIAVVLICACAVLFLDLGRTKGPEFEWTMVNVNRTDQQGDAHLIRVKNGKTVLIDTGHRKPAETSLIPFLAQHSIDVIDIVFITHPHLDHYAGLEVLLENDIQISKIYFNMPIKAVCDQEIPWGCNYQEIETLHRKLSDSGVPILQAEAGQSIELGKHTTIDLLYAFDGLNTPVGKTDVNDLSLIMMLRHEAFKFLFTGDLNWRIGGYLDKVPDDLSADVLKIPHHGVESTAPNSFFTKVSPQFALVPAPEALWQSDRSKRIRTWFEARKIPVFVNGIDGNVRVIVDGDDLSIQTENNADS